MTERIDLLKIAKEEQSGDLFKLLDSIYKRSKIQPRAFQTRSSGKAETSMATLSRSRTR